LFDERFVPLESQYHQLLSNNNASNITTINGIPSSVTTTSSSSVSSSPKDTYTNNNNNHNHNNHQQDFKMPTASYMWGIWESAGEITLLLESDELALFPEEVLETSPQQWRIIKLCGRPIAFNETGVVSAMSKVDPNIPSLNISTATTNCTLVPDELLETTVNKLSAALSCPVKYSTNFHTNHIINPGNNHPKGSNAGEDEGLLNGTINILSSIPLSSETIG
jgi:hypothetical protein